MNQEKSRDLFPLSVAAAPYLVQPAVFFPGGRDAENDFSAVHHPLDEPLDLIQVSLSETAPFIEARERRKREPQISSILLA